MYAGRSEVTSGVPAASNTVLRAAVPARNLAVHIHTRDHFTDATLTVITAGPIAVDTVYHDRTSVHGRPIALTRKEHHLLVALVERRGRTLSRPHLYGNIWNGNSEDDTRTVDMTISRLRVKLDDAASLIQTVRGVGYRFGDPLPRR